MKFEADCLQEIKEIPDNSIDMFLCDLPYGITQNAWDSYIPLDIKLNAKTVSPRFQSSLGKSFSIEQHKIKILFEEPHKTFYLQ